MPWYVQTGKIPWKQTCRLIPFYLFFLLLTLAASGNFFFWDTVQLGSKHAHWYYDNHFRILLLPDAIDSGHIPVFGMLLAAAWTIFQKSLLVSHLMMIPFLLGIVHQAYQLISFFFSSRNVFYVLILLLLDPALLSQSILVSPDVVLVFFLLFSLNMLLQNRRKWLLFSLAALSMISMRGMMLVVVLFIFDLFINLKGTRERRAHKMLNILKIYIPAGLLVMGYLAYHYHSKGWIGYHAGSPWAPSFEKVDFREFLYNLAIFFWRLIDSGRIVLWLVLLMVIAFCKKGVQLTENLKILGILGILMILILPASMLLHSNLLAHRYLLPIYLTFTLFVCYIVFEQTLNDKLKKPLFIMMSLGLITGNFWVYPDHIAKGWDATLAHVPYYHLRNKMVDYIETTGIPYAEIGTAFPNLASFKYTDLSANDQSFAEKDLTCNKYVFYSNVMNDFSDAEIDELKNSWIVEKKIRRLQVYVVLYRNPGVSP
ncbi:MAG: hypothetical protein R6X09_06750 [Bacteroidales bacterium]